jgi:short-subunit dehydrogenase
MKRGFSGSRVLITGASSGIGVALALRLANEGAQLALAARRADRLESLAEKLRAAGARAIAVRADVANEDECAAAVRVTVDALGGLDLLVNNAGASHYQAVRDCPAEVYERILRTNFLGAVHCTRHALPHLRREGGRILVISSLQGKTGFPGYAAYAASKHALHGFFESLRIEEPEVAVTLACPGPVDTEIHGGGAYARDGLMSADECARRILAATRRRRREVLLTASGRLAIWLRAFSPGFVDRAVQRRTDRFHR